MSINKNAFSLVQKKILLTGATGHLGRAIASGLAGLGADVIISGRSHGRLDDFVSELSMENLNVETAVFDLNDPMSVSDWFKGYGKKPIHGIINNAYSGSTGSIETASANDYRDSYEIGLVAAHCLLQNALPCMRLAVEKSGSSGIVNVASMYGLVSPDQRIYESKSAANPPFYGAAKAALIQWTKYAACEFAKEGIRFNSISPGPFPSLIAQNENKDLMTEIKKKVPMSRLGNPSEIIGPVLFLANPSSSYITGINLPVDGGWTAW